MTPVTDIAGFRRRLLAAVEKKTQVVQWLIQREAWDFFLVVFGECHPAGHYFWHFYDSSYITHPTHDPEGLCNALRDVYVALDTAIGHLLESVDQGTTVWLVSGDGMTANYSGSHILIDVLTRMGALHVKGVAAEPSKAAGGSPGPGRRDVLSTLRNMIPEDVRIAVSRALLSRQMQEHLSLRWKTAGISWPETRAFVIENANEGYIRINLKGREPEGTVSPGDEYANLCEEICRTARTMTNPATGQTAAKAVYRTDDICDGPSRGSMPDVVIIWNPDARVTNQLLMERYGLARVDSPNCGVAPYYTGNHWPNAFAAAIGPDVPQRLTIEGRSILDLAPTILARFGIETPAYMDGRVLHELTGGTRIVEPG
jgi:predicted AlkP superfamily phosphohydrolase/phosphomutase